ncbi:PREDICTED: methyltransferase-like protein 16 homolog [Ceratosolen solmsi marchali]|uniref:U6 small nuclear RNA (adenine-(43)-N(6))-methyltransferase n=1 Tax=Ceratosolen solmsi marchali TaxID=326594 RepID=A0AAJ7E3E6_9HYME|nr:PREDICTED: methyltransferase-like protein 16 homolog [Ceratosolen solmsi marchali]
MSLRKFMHKRNKYKEEPNFKQLAILYPEFRKVVITDIAGKVKLNFKNEETLRVLTKTLLKHDFNLDVEIPLNNLVPALPLRLNYILWIEDLLKHSGIIDLSLVHGIDIGTGAICIYPLLIARIFRSKMTCTDIDSETVRSAIKNSQINHLQDLVKVVLVKKDSILKDVLQEHDISFVMCNPPFFETDKNIRKISKLQPPRNAPTGIETELEVNGGEKEFILRLVKESVEFKNRVKIYTTMFGQKSSLSFIKGELAKNEIFNVTWTEFCQGYTKRWGIAWSFAAKSDVDLTTAPVIRTRTEVLKSKKDQSMEIIFPPKENLSCMDEIVSNLKKWMTELNIKIKEIEFSADYPCWACKLKGHYDTWTHARRKRRMIKRQEALKKSCIENSEFNNEMESAQFNRSGPTPPNEDDGTKSAEPLLICTLVVGENSETSESNEKNDDTKIFKICMIYESGCGGKVSLETLRQYIINKLKIRDFWQKQNSSKPNKRKRKR